MTIELDHILVFSVCMAIYVSIKEKIRVPIMQIGTRIYF